MNDKEQRAYLEAAVLDRERRLLNLASIIRSLTRNGAQIPRDCKVDYTITADEARVLGIQNWRGAMQPQCQSG